MSPLFHNFIPARGRCKVTQQPEEVAYIPKPTVSLDVVSLVANSYGYYSLKSSNALRSNSRCTRRRREGARERYTTPPSAARSARGAHAGASLQTSTADRRGVAPIRHPLASRDTPVAHTGEETTPSPHQATRCAAHPSIRFSPPGNDFSGIVSDSSFWQEL